MLAAGRKLMCWLYGIAEPRALTSEARGFYLCHASKERRTYRPGDKTRYARTRNERHAVRQTDLLPPQKRL